MKKLLVLLFAALLLVGCSSKEFSSNNYAQVSNGDEVIFTSPDNKAFTKQDLFNKMKNYDFSTTMVSELCVMIGEAAGLDMEEFNNAADEYINTFKENGAEYIIDYYGGEKYMHDSYVSSKVMDYFTEMYAEENFDAKVAESHPVKAQLAYFDVLEDAQSLLAAVGEGSTFEMAAAELGYGYEASETVYTDSDDLTLEVKDYLLNGTDNGLSPIITSVITTKDANGNTVEAPRYYVLNVVSRNVNDFRDDFLTVIGDGLESDDVLNYMFSKYDIKAYDQRVYELLSAKYEVLD